MMYCYQEYRKGDRVISLKPGSYGKHGTVIRRSPIRAGACGDVFHPAESYPQYVVLLDDGETVTLSNSHYNITPEESEGNDAARDH